MERARHRVESKEHLEFSVSCVDVKGSSKMEKDGIKSLKNEDKFEQLRRPDTVHVS